MHMLRTPKKTVFFKTLFGFLKMDIYKCPNFIFLFTLGYHFSSLFKKIEKYILFIFTIDSKIICQLLHSWLALFSVTAVTRLVFSSDYISQPITLFVTHIVTFSQANFSAFSALFSVTKPSLK
jgi:hypothetical protein